MIDEALNDIQEDFEELLYLYDAYKSYLFDFKKSFSNIKNHPAYFSISSQTDDFILQLEQAMKTIDELREEIRTDNTIDSEFLSQKKREFFIVLRTKIPLIAGLITATDWQSPSFAHSLMSEAGIQEGKIDANINDYKRDRHLNEELYQSQFLKEYVEGFKFPVNSYLTSSGMAALTTIITYLITHKKSNGPVLIGESIYFENTELIETFFSDKEIIKVQEMDTQSIINLFDEKKPDLLLFDSLCNAPNVAVPNLPMLLKHVSQKATKETFFIIDNSTLALALQPLKYIRLNRKLKLIVFESLNKYHQFGFDRVTAGIVWHWGYGFGEFNFARVHAGTNIPDTSCYALPKPNRTFLTRRLVRLQRNTNFIAHELSDYIKKHHPQKIKAIVYPGLPDHPSNAWSKQYFFQGSYFVISFQEQYQSVREYQKFVNLAIKKAKKHRVSLTGGTSFGFNTSRIYLTARFSDYGTPFIRVSIGTENTSELEKLKHVFEETIASF